MNLDLNDRVVLVAGSSRGIGKAIARGFLVEGCRTVITGRDATALLEAQSEFEGEFGTDRLMACRGDLTYSNVIEKILAQIRQRWGKIDCLVANIGNGRGKTGWELGEADWQTMFEVNLSSGWRLASLVIGDMVQSRLGSIVFIASITGVESTGAPIPYSAAKAALINYSKNLARQIGRHNIRVNCVAPGNILFPGGSWERHLAERKDEIMRFINAEVPLQRFGRPEEIADLVVFLSSERASFITGACVVVDGGQTKSI